MRHINKKVKYIALTIGLVIGLLYSIIVQYNFNVAAKISSSHNIVVEKVDNDYPNDPLRSRHYEEEAVYDSENAQLFYNLFQNEFIYKLVFVFLAWGVADMVYYPINRDLKTVTYIETKLRSNKSDETRAKFRYFWGKLLIGFALSIVVRLLFVRVDLSSII